MYIERCSIYTILITFLPIEMNKQVPRHTFWLCADAAHVCLLQGICRQLTPVKSINCNKLHSDSPRVAQVQEQRANGTIC